MTEISEIFEAGQAQAARLQSLGSGGEEEDEEEEVAEPRLPGGGGAGGGVAEARRRWVRARAAEGRVGSIARGGAVGESPTLLSIW